MSRTIHQAVFFELDGVLLRDARLGAGGTLAYLPGALAALARLDTERFRLFVATSRHDIALGALRERDFRKLCDTLLVEARNAGAPITQIYSCPFHPKGRGKWKRESVFRKPAPGMFKMAQQEHDLNLQRSWMIGHTTADMLSASRAGLGTVLVRTGQGGKDNGYVVEPHFIEDDLAGAVARINSFEHALRV